MIVSTKHKPPPLEFFGRMPARQRNLNGFIYFVRLGDKVKIGFSVNVKDRLESLQAGSPEDLELLRIVQGDEESEYRYHKAFAEHRYKREWFWLRGELAAWLEVDDGTSEAQDSNVVRLSPA